MREMLNYRAAIMLVGRQKGDWDLLSILPMSLPSKSVAQSYDRPRADP